MAHVPMMTDQITDYWHPGGDPHAISELADALRALAEDCRTQAQAVTGPFMRLEWKGGARDAFKERLAIITGDRLTLDGSRLIRQDGLIHIARLADRLARSLDDGTGKGFAISLVETQLKLLNDYGLMAEDVPLKAVRLGDGRVEITYDDAPELLAETKIFQYQTSAVYRLEDLVNLESRLIVVMETILDELRTLSRRWTAPIVVPGQWRQIEVEYGPLRHFCETTVPDVVNRLLTAAADLARSRRLNAPIPSTGLMPDGTPDGLLAETRRTLNSAVGQAAWALRTYTETLKDGMHQRWRDRPRLEPFHPRIVPTDPLNSDWDTQWDAAREIDAWDRFHPLPRPRFMYPPQRP